MATMKCPKCGRALDVTGLAPGSGITCACGNVASVSTGGSRKTLYIILGVVGVLLACPCVGVLAGIAIPNYIRYQSRAKQAECRMNLKSWYTSQKMHYSQYEAYEPSLSKVGFALDRGNRYAYLTGEGPMEARGEAQLAATEGAVSVGVDTFRHANLRTVSVTDLPPEVADRLGVSGECPDCAITMACAGNIDNDDTLDVWMVSTGALDLKDVDGAPVAEGVPAHIVSDLTD
jgi:Tfp pilus assembly major pilin PilA